MLRIFQNKNLILALIIASSVLINSINYFASGFKPILSDFGSAACSSQVITDNNDFGSDEDYAKGYCWSRWTYPLTSLFFSINSSVSNLAVPLTVMVFYLLIYCLLPLLAYCLNLELFNNEKIAVIAAFLAAFAVPFARMVNVTPQNMIGITMTLFFLFLLIKYLKTSKIRLLILAIVVFLLLGIFHHLTFLTVAFSLLIYSIIKACKNRKLIALVAALLFALFLISYYLSRDFGFIAKLFIENIEGGANWDAFLKTSFWIYPVIIGYVLFILTILGIVFAIYNYKQFGKLKEIFLILFCFLIFIFSFTQAYRIGFMFYNFRISAFLVIPALIFAPYGFWNLYVILKDKLSRKALYAFLIIVFLACVSHFFTFRQDEFENRNKQYLIKSDYKEAINWLNKNSNTETKVLTILDAHDSQIKLFSYLYKGKIFYFKKNNYSISDDKEFYDKFKDNFLNNSNFETFLGKLFGNNSSVMKIRERKYLSSLKNNKELFESRIILKNPDGALANQYYNDLGYDYVLIRNYSDVADNFKKSRKFKKIFDNGKWIIFEKNK